MLALTSSSHSESFSRVDALKTLQPIFSFNGHAVIVHQVSHGFNSLLASCATATTQQGTPRAAEDAPSPPLSRPTE
jgi:hypothetical protein